MVYWDFNYGFTTGYMIIWTFLVLIWTRKLPKPLLKAWHLKANSGLLYGFIHNNIGAISENH
jgi:hypothetical protein